MTLKQLVILSLIISASVMVNAQDAETYFGLTFADTPLTVESPVNVVALDDVGRIANKIELNDGQPFYTPYNFRANSVSYARSFVNTYWQPLYIPYNMRYDDWCDIAEVAALTEVFQYDDDTDGIFDRTILAFERVKAGALAANAPYIIRPYNTGTVVIESKDCTFKATPDENGRVGCSAANFIFMLIGTYEDTSISGYLGEYVLSTNTFNLSDGTVVKPGGIYLQMSPNDYGYNPEDKGPLPESISLLIDDELVGITDMTADYTDTDVLYDLMGRKVIKPTQGLYVSGKRGKVQVISNRQ